MFHAGTCRDETGVLRTAGGRVLVVTALGATLEQARETAYKGVAEIGFDGMQYRSDIARRQSRFERGVIRRYSLPEMAAVFADEARFGLWLEIELLAVEAWAELGVVPAEHAAACPRPCAEWWTPPSSRRVAEREAVTDHDVAAFVDVVQESIGPPEGSWIHYGLTSSDVVDTALSATLVRAADLLLEAVDDLVSVTKRRAIRVRRGPDRSAARTACTPSRRRSAPSSPSPACRSTGTARAFAAHASPIAVGKLSGAVGTYSNIEPAVEAYVCSGARAAARSGHPGLARDRHAEYLYACAALGTTIESLATEIRHAAAQRGR